MDFFKKLEELHAKKVTPKEFKEMTGGSQEEVMQKVMDFIDKFDAKQAELEIAEKGKIASIKPAATPAAVAASASVEWAAIGKERKTATKSVDKLTAKVLARLKAAGIEAPKSKQSGKSARKLGDLKKFEIKDGIVRAEPNEKIRKKGIVIKGREPEGLK